MDTSLGLLLLNEALPEDLRSQDHRLDKKGIQDLMRQVAERYPDRYKEIHQKLNDIGREASWNEGLSVSLSALRRSPAKEKLLAGVRAQVSAVINDSRLTDEQRSKGIVDALLPASQTLTKAMMEEAKQENNPFYLQLTSGARGKASDYNSIRGADLLVQDQNDNILPVPVFHSYAEGLDPVEYFAGLYSQRKGQIAVKMGTADAGFASKKLINAAHRIVVNKDAPAATRLPVGLPVDTGDKDTVGAVLAAPVKLSSSAVIAAGTTITSQMLKAFQEDGQDEVIVHSPMTELSEDGGISRFAAGRRDRFDLSRIGDNVGIAAAQSIGEKMSQGLLSSKHSTANIKVGRRRDGIEYLTRLLESPEQFPEAGPLAPEAGIVQSIDKAAQGGHYITVNRQRLYAHPDINPTVKVGDTVDEGDDLTDGIPHPTELIERRGIGEARRVYVGMLREGLANSGITSHRRNLEAVVSGLMNWAKITDADGIGDGVVDDVVSYNRLAHDYRPREDARLAPVRQSVGRYLEEPALHYSIGTKVSKRVADQLERHGIKDLQTHEEAPGFRPYMQRGVMSVHSDEDWTTQLAGFYTESAFNRSVSRGAESNPNSTSYVAALARSTDFGKHLEQTGTYGAVKPTPVKPLVPATPKPTAPAATPTPPATAKAPLDRSPLDD